MAKNFEVGMILQTKGGKEAQKEIENVQKNIDSLRKKAIELNKEFKEKQALKVDTKEVEQKLKDVNKQLGEEKKLIGLLSEEAKRAGNELKALADRATVDNLRDMDNVLGGISGAIVNFGKDIVGAASQAENFAVAMSTAFQGNQEAADRMLQWAKEFANATPFETNEIIDATIKLKSYGVAAEDIPNKLRLIGDMASAMNKSLDEAVEAVNKATVGELERLEGFAITKKMLNDEVNGTLVNSKNQITDMNLLMESLSQIMEKRFAGGMERASKTTAGQLSNLRGEVQNLKEELGKEFLPSVNEAVEGLTGLTKWLNSTSVESKSAAADLIKLAGSATVAAVSIAGAGLKLKEFQMAMEAAKMGSLATVGIIGGIAIAVGFLANEYIKHWQRMEEQKSDRIEAETKKIAGGFKNVQEAIDLVNKTPVEIALDPSLEAKIASLEGRIKALREEAAKKLDDEGKTFSFELASNPTDRNNDMINSYQMEYSEAMDFLLQKQTELNKKLSETGLPAEVVQKYKGQIAEVNLEIKRLYETLEKENPEMYKRQIDMMEGSLAKAEQGKEIADGEKAGKAFYEGFTKAKEEAQKKSDSMVDQSGLKLPGIDDTELNAKIQHQKTLLELNKQTTAQFVANLEDYKIKYKLTQEEMDKIDLEVFRVKEKQASEEKKINDGKIKEADRVSKKQAAKAKQDLKEWEKSQKEKAAAEEEAWKKTIQVQAETLEAEGKTVEAKKLLLKTKEKDLRDSGVAETEIVKWKEAQIQKIEADGLEEAKKKAEEKLKANKEMEEAIAGLSETAAERQISSIKKQTEEWEKSGADIIKIEEYKNKAIQKLQEETWQDFKQKEDQKKKEIEDTAKTIQSINDKIAANNQKIKDIESGSSFGSGSPLMSSDEALSKSFSEHLDPYIEKLEQSKALEQENQALMTERDKAFQKEQEQQSELKKIQEERNTAQDAFNTALQGTVDKYEAVSKTSPWEEEKKKIEEATAAAEKYNSTSSGGGKGSGSDAGKGNGSGDGSGGNVNSGGEQNSGNNTPDTSKIYGSDVGTYGHGNTGAGSQGNMPGNKSSGPGLYTADTYGSDNTLQPSVRPDYYNGSRTEQGWNWTPNYKTSQDLGSWGFDNPVNDSMAFKAMEGMTSEFAIPIVTKSMKDMVTNMLGGMVSSVSNILNSPSYNTTNSQISNYKSMTNITNYNTSLDNKQITATTPVERNVRELNALTAKFRKPS